MASEAAAASSRLVSDVEPHETIVLFDVAASFDEAQGRWLIPLHVWVYAPQHSRARKAGIARIFERAYGLERTTAAAPFFDERINLLLADNKRGRRVVVSLAGRTFALPLTSPDGHARACISLSAGEAEVAASAGSLAVSVVLPPRDGRSFTAQVHLVPPRGLTVISDLDDTVKVSHVTEKARLWESTFYKPFAPVPGMAELYRRLAAQGAAFHFVSSSPWHLYAPLTRFLLKSGFPPATIDLKTIRLKDRSILNLLRPPSETKPPQIEALLSRFPSRNFILIGDSGEQDTEIYAGMLRRHPEQIIRVMIRNVTDAQATDARFAAAFAGIDSSRWQLFKEPGEIRLS